MRRIPSPLFAGLALLAIAAGAAHADTLRYRFVAIDAQGNTAPTALGPGGAPGVYTSYRGTEAVPHVKRPTHLLPLVHPCTGRTLLVPVTLPEDTPRVERRSDRIIYNYGDYTVEVRFLADGSVEVVYNSGLLRRL